MRLLLDARTTDSSSLKEDCSSSAPVAVCGFFFLLMSCAPVQAQHDRQGTIMAMQTAQAVVGCECRSHKYTADLA